MGKSKKNNKKIKEEVAIPQQEVEEEEDDPFNPFTVVKSSTGHVLVSQRDKDQTPTTPRGNKTIISPRLSEERQSQYSEQRSTSSKQFATAPASTSAKMATPPPTRRDSLNPFDWDDDSNGNSRKSNQPKSGKQPLSQQRETPFRKEHHASTSLSSSSTLAVSVVSDRHIAHPNKSSVEQDTGNGSFPIGIIPSKNSKSPKDSPFSNMEIYHNNSLSSGWLVLAIIFHVVQWSLLLSYTSDILSPVLLSFLAVGVSIVALLLVAVRFLVKKKVVGSHRLTHFGDGRLHAELLPEDEADNMPNVAVLSLMLATLLEGGLFAMFVVAAAGNTVSSTAASNSTSDNDAVLEILRFASITFLAFHRVIRPANRADPMRTILELEVVSVCWDALDGSTLYQLLNTPDYSDALLNSIRCLMVFWYMSVGFRMSLMFATHLDPQHPILNLLLSPPYFFSNNPTVDRSLSALRLRCSIVLSMALSEIYAACMRFSLLMMGKLDSLQQEMLFKNVLFLLTIASTRNIWASTITRNWNSVELGFGFNKPTVQQQRQFARYLFCLSYLLLSLMMLVILMHAEPKEKWGVHFITDVGLVLFFYYYCSNVDVRCDVNSMGSKFFPQPGFVLFPKTLAIVSTALLMLNLYIARIPALYYFANNLPPGGGANDDGSNYYTYNSAILLVMFTMIPVVMLTQFWSFSTLLFHRELTCCGYNHHEPHHAIHDPIITMVVSATTTEGSLDILSATSLMSLATVINFQNADNNNIHNNNLSGSSMAAATSAFIIIFALLELVNGVCCFNFSVPLSGGMRDSPLDLVRWKAYLRAFRGVIDLGVILLRLVLWTKFDIVNSVFMIKNLYNLLHTAALVERYVGSRYYPSNTLFTSEIHAHDWYGMTPDEWKEFCSPH